MKIATFNIWNSDRGMPLREQQIIQEINAVDAEVICLQEVKEGAFAKLTSILNQYSHSYFHTFNKDYDGLAVFSKHPLLLKMPSKAAIIVTCEKNGTTFLVINVHLPWDTVTKKEQYIVDILKDASDITADYAFLTGDFNCSPNSSVHHFLLGDRTLLNTEAAPYWDDLAEVHSEITNTPPEYTLDLRTNPRWQGRRVAVCSGRVDRIYFRDAFPKPYPQLKSFSLFGKTIDEQSGYCASDHYGVVAEIDFE